MQKKPYFYIALALIIIGGFIIIYMLLDLNASGWTVFGDEKIDLQTSANFGAYVGGFVGTLFSLAGFFLVIASINEQKTAFIKERFESRFFEFVRFHRDNVTQLELHREISNFTFRGKQVFKVIYDQFTEAYSELSDYFATLPDKDLAPASIYLSDYYQFLQNNTHLPDRSEVRLKELAHINICYLVVFFGLSKEGFRKIDTLLKDKMNSSYYQPILQYLSMKPVLDSKFFNSWVVYQSFFKRGAIKELITDYHQKRYYKYYGGHQFRLGQYFRHLFQSISFVDNRTEMLKGDRESYVKIIRAQLSDYELVLFFINSLSFLGSEWEIGLNSFKRPGNTPRKFITTYHLIKNIPDSFLADTIDCKKYYPNVHYDFI